MRATAARKATLGIALAATLAATGWVASEERRQESLEIVPARDPRAAAAAAAAPAKKAPVSRTVDLARLRERSAIADDADLFPSQAWAQPRAAPAAPGGSAETKPAPPAAPPLPFTFFGRMVEANRTMVFLNRNDDTLVVKAGDTIDGTYRVDEIGPTAVVLTYLPLNQRQLLEIGAL